MSSPYGQQPYPSANWAPQLPPRNPSNGLAVSGFVVALIGAVLALIPIVGTVSWLISPVGFVLSAVGLGVSGRRGGAGRGLGIAGLVLGVIGVVLCIAYTVSFANYVSSSPSTFPGVGAPPAVYTSAAPSSTPRYTFEISGTASAANVNFSVDGSSGSADSVKVPWTKQLDANSTMSYHFSSLSAFTPMGSQGTLTCTISDESGTVIATQTASSQGGEYGSANVNCFG